ncbi:hypothetical protein RclHR1_00040007 [Rhizophagus clarus]|uniref:RNA-dependent RNA polymerase n=1 Tax=Rhizophagus clarus TaxID=94130 RepID=A0A2Z6RE45_9GLOM|nr:hypothetical protein RclHR1_00040007 [Rhizophagus clarus]
MVECNISFSYLHNYNLSEDFFFLLARLSAQWHLANIKISDGHYKFLTFSSNKSRNHSWFFAPTYDLTADDIRDCFSSTRAIQYLPVYYIKEIPNVVRGIPYEDNNVIALAIKICWIKASKSELESDRNNF